MCLFSNTYTCVAFPVFKGFVYVNCWLLLYALKAPSCIWNRNNCPYEIILSRYCLSIICILFVKLPVVQYTYSISLLFFCFQPRKSSFQKTRSRFQMTAVYTSSLLTTCALSFVIWAWKNGL